MSNIAWFVLYKKIKTTEGKPTHWRRWETTHTGIHGSACTRSICLNECIPEVSFQDQAQSPTDARADVNTALTKKTVIINYTMAFLIPYFLLCILYWHSFLSQKGLLSFPRLCLELQIVAFVNNVHKERLLNACWVIFVLHFAPSVHMRTTPTPFPDKPKLAVKAENVSQLHPIFRTCNEEKM